MPVAKGAFRTRQKFKKVIAAYAIYTKRSTTFLDFVLGINRPCAPLVVVLTTQEPIMAQYWPNAGCQWRIQNASEISESYNRLRYIDEALYDCTTDFVWGVNIPYVPLVVVFFLT
ncbi:hypothetical protein T265_07696 [Opisthorchis viverrini]|uniref:Uncharacterized protein n=1 Tax=Opisthorchis viverrini TaxID=6198 RepID=A0A075AAW4_OPIVI|nr:hypothetical protein T265_07696 [Opisthorchis viverrini]KER24694.1 hypothetical protein T265_07696 [Opisthorchis viverrini]